MGIRFRPSRACRGVVALLVLAAASGCTRQQEGPHQATGTAPATATAPPATTDTPIPSATDATIPDTASPYDALPEAVRVLADKPMIQVAAGETALLRFVNLGFEQHAMQLLGPRMRVVGHDATFLGSQIYETNTIYIGPGEARDVLVTAPAFNASVPGGADAAGAYNRYWLRNRNAQRLVNGNQPGLGGMVTEMRVYAALPPQPGPNKTV